jgi:pimeloyl-ACP methyl ester carboxylesterase
VRQIAGPVLLAGHSYGGAVITVAGTAARHVVGLVYVAAFIPDEGETLAEIGARFPHTRLAEVLRQNTFPLDGTSETAVELSITPEARRRPPSLNGRSRPPHFSSTGRRLPPGERCPRGPSWRPADESIHPDAQPFMAERAQAWTIEVPGPHTVVVSEPARVADRIRGALRAAPLAYAPTPLPSP